MYVLTYNKHYLVDNKIVKTVPVRRAEDKLENLKVHISFLKRYKRRKPFKQPDNTIVFYTDITVRND